MDVNLQILIRLNIQFNPPRQTCKGFFRTCLILCPSCILSVLLVIQPWASGLQDRRRCSTSEQSSEKLKATKESSNGRLQLQLLRSENLKGQHHCACDKDERWERPQGSRLNLCGVVWGNIFPWSWEISWRTGASRSMIFSHAATAQITHLNSNTHVTFKILKMSCKYSVCRGQGEFTLKPAQIFLYITVLNCCTVTLSATQINRL